MSKYTIAFDVDDTLVSKGEPNLTVVALLKILAGMKNVKIVVWSGRGKEYAQAHVDSLKITKEVKACYGKQELPRVDIAFDNEDSFDLADKNLIVK